jgi:tellurite resistance protein
MTDVDHSLLRKVASKLREAPSYSDKDMTSSILKLAASSYGFRPVGEEITVPTGFDPNAAALFEAMVESAYLVASADGEFDAAERATFEHLVIAACEGAVAERQVHALLADLEEQLAEDGADKRIEMVARTVTKPEHAREILRVAALLAQVSGGVSDDERRVLEKLARATELDRTSVDGALREVARALAD